MGDNFDEVLKLIGYIALVVAIGAVGVCIKESIGGMFDIISIILGWGFLAWIWTKNKTGGNK